MKHTHNHSEYLLNIQFGDKKLTTDEKYIFKNDEGHLSEDGKVLTVPEGMIELGYNVRQFDTILEEVKLPGSLKKINNDAFNSCPNLKRMNLDYVEYIGNLFNSVFSIETLNLYNCKDADLYFTNQNNFLTQSKATTIVYPKNATVARLTSNVQKIILHKKIKEIFYNKDQILRLKEIEIDKDNPYLEFKDDCLFDKKNGKKLLTLKKKLTLTAQQLIDLPPEDSMFVEELTVTDSLERFPKKKFYNLKKLNLPQKFNDFESKSLYNSQIESLTLPESVKQISFELLYIPTLTELTLACDLQDIYNLFLSSRKSYLYSTNKSGKFDYEINDDDYFTHDTNLQKLNFTKDGEIVYSISKDSLAQSKVLNIPDSVKYIHESFSNIPVKEINFPQSLCSIADNSFNDCSEIEKLTFTKNINMIRDSFNNLTGLKEIVFSTDNLSIGEDCFTNCSSLIKLDLSKGIKDIGKGSFSHCSNLKELIVPASLKINYTNIQGMDSLESFITDDPGIQVKDNCVFTTAGNKLLYALGPKEMKTFTVPGYIQSIKIGAFRDSISNLVFEDEKNIQFIDSSCSKNKELLTKLKPKIKFFSEVKAGKRQKKRELFSSSADGLLNSIINEINDELCIKEKRIWVDDENEKIKEITIQDSANNFVHLTLYNSKVFEWSSVIKDQLIFILKNNFDNLHDPDIMWFINSNQLDIRVQNNYASLF